MAGGHRRRHRGYARTPHEGLVAPPRKKLLLVSNGLFAKYGMWQARRQGQSPSGWSGSAAEKADARPGP